MLWSPVPPWLRQDSCQIQCDAAVVHRVRVRLCDLCPLLSLHQMATDPITAFETRPHKQNPHLSSLLTLLSGEQILVAFILLCSLYEVRAATYYLVTAESSLLSANC